MNWFWKLLGYHVCDKFTPWTAHAEKFSRVPYSFDERLRSGWSDRIEFTQRWQERACLDCGRIEQRLLDY